MTVFDALKRAQTRRTRVCVNPTENVYLNSGILAKRLANNQTHWAQFYVARCQLQFDSSSFNGILFLMK